MSDTLFTKVATQIFKDAQLLRWWPLEGGVSATTHALEVRTLDATRRVVIRQLGEVDWKSRQEGVTATEFALLRELKRKGIAVPDVYLTDGSSEVLPKPFVAMEFLNGTTEIEDSELSSALQQAAHFLADLHALDLNEVSLSKLAPVDDPCADLWTYLAVPAVDAGDLERQLREALTSRSIVQTNKGTLLHGDFWPGNWLWQDGQLAAVIDWEDCAIGDPLADIAAARAEILCAFGSQAMELFTENYQSRHTIDWADLPLWEVFVSAAALSSMSQWGLEPADEAQRRQATQQFMNRAADELLEQHRTY